MAQEFLPLCDVLFNIISLASYFCDVVFDVVTVYTLYPEDHKNMWFHLSLSCIVTSLLISQLMSVKWYFKRNSGSDFHVSFMAIIHLLQCGVLWRYFKLFLPVDLSVVKNEVRDLCMLRLVHAFCEAAPMLMIQLYLIWEKPSIADLSDLNIVSTVLSLFSVCWALASFSKNVRRRNIHRLVLTWLGVIFQFFWRLGTVSSRVVVLTVYATLYHYWVFVVIGLHWISMFLWLMFPKNIFQGENIFWVRKTVYSILIAFVYIFCYINLQEVSSQQKMMAFYITMFLENTLLMTIWLGLRAEKKWFDYPVVTIVWGGFILGILFMILYYRFFHIQRLKHTFTVTTANSNCLQCRSGSCVNHVGKSSKYFASETFSGANLPHSLYKSQNHTVFHLANSHIHNGALTNTPGVFNCRLNPALKRKKKKPSTFIPPPPPVSNLTSNGKILNPFWKKTSPKSYSSDHESSVGSRINIQQKLQEKKQQQLQELKEIEEEIKQGKIKRPRPLEFGEQGTLRQPIPQSKKQPWLQPENVENVHPVMCRSILAPFAIAGLRTKAKQRSKTPEILLLPDSLESIRIYDYQEPKTVYSVSPPHLNFTHRTSDISSNSNMSGASRSKGCLRTRSRGQHKGNHMSAVNMQNSAFKSYRIPSDLDSQISLPRSYTLPREFRYYRRPRSRKPIRTEHFAASNNSSDGDVDSADENEDMFSGSRISGHPRYRPYMQPLRITGIGAGQLHETKL